MAKLDFDIGARVHCTDGECGKLLKVVVDPHTQRVIDLVVERGFLLTKDRVVPADLVKSARGEEVSLDISGDALEAYPVYRDVEFSEPAPEVGTGRYSEGDVRCWQTSYGLACPRPVVPMVRKKIHEGVDADLTVLERGTPVRNTRGTIGRVDHLLADAESGEVTHLVVRKGLIPYYPIIPLSTVKAVGNEAVTVDLTEKELDSFPRYRSRGADDIEAELGDRLAKLGFDLAQMHVAVQAGTVELTGWVPSVAAKRHAEAVARAVEGVIDVENLLDTDVILQTRVMHAIFTDPRTSVAVIEVVSEGGVIALQGDVDSAEIRAAAEEIVAAQPGVVSVVNGLEVKPDQNTEWLKARSFALGTWWGRVGGAAG